ncbi:hypothetical protein PILCRDRAFT_93398 [Piloderma croceum F 1598]|uniref:Uncharacterized protein n=1 Tax=Piloderma croceum (strain F 1598) TaxID=765440 RepID=A0A0C3EJ38_PILCF|nr:hypothetical protein PILCRDRAFT_93398 [Piloderma croceum F 1598]
MSTMEPALGTVKGFMASNKTQDRLIDVTVECHALNQGIDMPLLDDCICDDNTCKTECIMFKQTSKNEEALLDVVNGSSPLTVTTVARYVLDTLSQPVKEDTDATSP